ncbi:cytochrome oxidase assembly protein 1 [Thecaphora frezii]
MFAMRASAPSLLAIRGAATLRHSAAPPPQAGLFGSFARSTIRSRAYATPAGRDSARPQARVKADLPNVPVSVVLAPDTPKQAPRPCLGQKRLEKLTRLSLLVCYPFDIDLDARQNRKPVFILAALIAIGSWSAFAAFATNKERLSSSVFKSALIQLKDSSEVQAALGDPIMLVPSTFGDPWVSGSVNMMQGRVDMSFRVQGRRDAGTAYFTSIRRDQNKAFEVLRFLVVTDAGETVSLLSSAGASHDTDGEIESNTTFA